MSQTTYHAFMLDHASGNLPAALMVAGDLHVSLSQHGAQSAAVWDAVGGVLLENASSEIGMKPGWRAARRKMKRPKVAELLSRDLDTLAWRKGLSGVRHARAGIPGGAFMRLEPWQAVPLHGHSALEATIVLRGTLLDGEEVYEQGDLALGIPGETHKPEAQGSEPCICYVGRGPRPFWRLS